MEIDKESRWAIERRVLIITCVLCAFSFIAGYLSCTLSTFI